MTLRLSLVLLLTVAASGASAQRFEPTGLTVRLRAGFDQHQHGALAAWQRAEQAAVGGSGIALQETDAFPAFPSVRAEVGYVGGRWNRRRDLRYEVGAEVGVGSTGGRLYYEDYSGAFVVDRRVRRLVVGAYAEHEVGRVRGVWLGVRGHARANVTTVSYQRDVRLAGEDGALSSATFRAVPISVEPSLAAEADASQRLRVRAQVGYEWSTPARLGEAEPLPAEARWSTDVAPSVNWRGVRAGVGVAVRFGD